jgi:translation initiation factor 2 alpha subunit (eIF-2alpha)
MKKCKHKNTIDSLDGGKSKKCVDCGSVYCNKEEVWRKQPAIDSLLKAIAEKYNIHYEGVETIYKYVESYDKVMEVIELSKEIGNHCAEKTKKFLAN